MISSQALISSALRQETRGEVMLFNLELIVKNCYAGIQHHNICIHFIIMSIFGVMTEAELRVNIQ